MSERQPQKLGRYQLLALLATGGMAEIYLARQTGIGGFEKLVVLKKILSHLAREKTFVEMFFDEAVIAAKLNHPNVVQIFDLGEADGQYYIAMEYLEGESLGYLMSEAHRGEHDLPPELAAGIVSRVCDGLDYAHTFRDDTGRPLNIVHRDVSPHNIIVLFSGGIKLVDFGIAKAASKMHQTRIGTLKGKLAYMSPEQVVGEPVDARSDIFSLGVVFWELLTRRRLFKRESEPAVMHAIMNQPIAPVREVKPQTPTELAAIVDRALRKQAADRYPSAAEMGAAIQDALRVMSAAAGVKDIANFINQVFADRARTKQRLLEEIREKGADAISLGVLKPASGSMPSKSSVEPNGVVAPAAAETRILASGSQDATATRLRSTDAQAATGPARRSPAVWVGVGVLVLCTLALAWLWWPQASEPQAPAPGPARAQQSARWQTTADAAAAEDDAAQSPVSADRPPTAETPGGARTATAPPDEQAGSAAAVASKPTRLSVRSRPSGCEVRIAGRAVDGATPLTDIELDADTEHEVAVVCKGHHRQVRRFTGRPGGRVRLAFAPKRIGPRSKRPRLGSLKLATVPWSEVYLGKRKLGMTPLLGLKLPAGRHKLTAINKTRRLEKTILVTIEAGKTTTMKVKLTE